MPCANYRVVRNPDHPQYGFRWLVQQHIGKQWIGIGLFRRINDVREWGEGEGLVELKRKVA